MTAEVVQPVPQVVAEPALLAGQQQHLREDGLEGAQVCQLHVLACAAVGEVRQAGLQAGGHFSHLKQIAYLKNKSTWRYVMTSPRMMVSNSRAPISPAALHNAPLRVISTKSDSDMWIRWSCACAQQSAVGIRDAQIGT
jgi:hypothetical protein